MAMFRPKCGRPEHVAPPTCPEFEKHARQMLRRFDPDRVEATGTFTYEQTLTLMVAFAISEERQAARELADLRAQQSFESENRMYDAIKKRQGEWR